MKKIIITITPSGLVIDSDSLALIAIDPVEIISEKFFLKIFNEPASFCLN